MVAHILTDCSRGTGEGQSEEEEVLVQVLELATDLGVCSERIVEESESVVSLQVVFWQVVLWQVSWRYLFHLTYKNLQ